MAGGELVSATRPYRQRGGPITLAWLLSRTAPDGECRIWQGAKNPQGYGTFRSARARHVLVHRAVCELVRGPIPPGLLVRHSCSRPACVRPEHLSVGTHADNVADRVAADRSAKGSQNGRAKLTERDVRAIRLSLKLGVTTCALAKRYGVTPKAIRLIRDGRNWAHLQTDPADDLERLPRLPARDPRSLAGGGA